MSQPDASQPRSPPASRTERIVTIGSLALLLGLVAFGAGFAFRHKNIWPTGDLLILQSQIRFWQKYGEWGRTNQFTPADVAAGAPRARLHDAAAMLPGYRSILGYDADMETYSLRLLDSAGAQVHVWPLDYETIIGRPGEVEGLNNPHGLEMLPDGSVVINFGAEGEAMARLDACGTPLWVQEGRYHHSVDADAAGLLWTWFTPEDDRSQIQFIRALDPETGVVVREIAMADVAAAAPENAILMGIPEGFEFRRKGRLGRGMDSDIFHPNDVEPLDAEMAAAFPQFAPGDLLISLRNLDLVAVLDPETLTYKWSSIGPWIRQHDPDFAADGRIDVYNNNAGRGRSDITSIDPATGAVARRFTSEDSRFYSGPQGKQQRLPNGAYLITVPDEGRVLELSESGGMVFEYVNVVNDGLTGRVLNAVWLPEDFYAAPPACPG